VPKKSYAETTHDWELLVRSLQDHADELPHLAEAVQELLGLLQEAQRHRTRYLALRGEAQAESRRLQQTLARGRSLESRIRAGIRGVYGFDDPVLLRHGMKPRRSRGGKLEEGGEGAEAAGSEEAGATGTGEGGEPSDPARG
jgi:hypothetical protein